MRTRNKLAAELRKVAETASPGNAAKYEAFAKRALTGEFDDFSDAHVCPITQLHAELSAAGFTQFAKRVANGEFDATAEESEAWAGSPEGQATMGLLHRAPERLGDGPIEPEYETTMKEVARLIDMMFNGGNIGEDKKIGFILQVFPLNNHEGRCNYMSNAKREDVVIMLKEQLRRFEGQAEVTGHA